MKRQEVNVADNQASWTLEAYSRTQPPTSARKLGAHKDARLIQALREDPARIPTQIWAPPVAMPRFAVEASTGALMRSRMRRVHDRVLELWVDVGTFTQGATRLLRELPGLSLELWRETKIAIGALGGHTKKLAKQVAQTSEPTLERTLSTIRTAFEELKISDVRVVTESRVPNDTKRLSIDPSLRQERPEPVSAKEQAPMTIIVRKRKRRAPESPIEPLEAPLAPTPRRQSQGSEIKTHLREWPAPPKEVRPTRHPSKKRQRRTRPS